MNLQEIEFYEPTQAVAKTKEVGEDYNPWNTKSWGTNTDHLYRRKRGESMMGRKRCGVV